MRGIPSINVVLDLVCSGLAVLDWQEFIDPSDEMIVEATLDELMENIGGNQLTDVNTRELVFERLLVHEWQCLEAVQECICLP